MKSRSIALLTSLCLLLYAGLTVLIQWQWTEGCPYATAQVTPVYTPGLENEIAATLPAGTPCRTADTVGDSWQIIEYMINGATCTGMVRTGMLARR